jgi:K+-transporting ATPase ATPase A chain
MTANGILQIALFFVALLLLTKPLGAYMARVFSGERTFLSPVLGPIERGLYRLFGVREDEDMKWTVYAFALLAFSVVGLLLSYTLLRLQGFLPFNPQKFGTTQMTPDLAFNTAVSFTTNTNWQNYVPETTVSYFSNMVALAIHNWMSGAAGIAVAIALVRGFTRRANVPTPTTDHPLPTTTPGIGNFWVDVTRATLYVLLPICLVYALFLVAQGVPQNFAPYTNATTVEGGTQVIPQGPVASQEAIKMLGTNGGGIFNANSSHPYENPTPLSNFLEMLSIFLIPAALTYTFGKMVGNTKQGWALFAAMGTLFLVGVFVCYGAEATGNPQMHAAGVPGGNMEGKEVRFGIANSALFATITTAASCGAVNSMHDSFTPIGGLVPLLNIQLGEVIFGGVGAGLYGILMFAILAVFIAGLMVGRTPEYLGKKIEQYEVKMAMLAVLVLAASILGFTAIGTNLNLPKEPETTALVQFNKWPGSAYGGSDSIYGATYNNVNNSGPHGLTEILYAFTSATGNNGSAFAGLTGNTPFYNITLGLAMLIGRFLMIVPLLAIAGSVAAKKYVPASAGTFPTDGGTFVALLVGVIIIVGALTYLPALALGPIVEHFQMYGGKVY